MPSFKPLEDRKKALERKRELFRKFGFGKASVQNDEEPNPVKQPSEIEPPPSPYVRPPILQVYGQAKVPLHQDDDIETSYPSSGLQDLVDLYYHAAKHRSRHLVLVWPAAPKSLILVHALATLERWAVGDKMGIRGLAYPVKTNAFHALKHIHLDRLAIVGHAQRLLEEPFTQNPEVTRGCESKDAYLYSLSSLKPDEQERFNPSIGELLPHFLTGPQFTDWASCADELLTQVGAKLARRKQKKALERNRLVIGDPKTAPDAIFALDGRLTREDQRSALLALKKNSAPEVAIINATKAVRRESKSWRKGIARFCILIDEIFTESPLGVVVIVDDPHALTNVRDELNELNQKREPAKRWKPSSEYVIQGIPSTSGGYGLVDADTHVRHTPAPRELNISVVDSEATKVVHSLQRIARNCPGGRDSAQAVFDAANFITRLAAWPCGVSDVLSWLEGTGVNELTRSNYSWLKYVGGLQLFDRAGCAGEHRDALQNAIEDGSKLFSAYHQATPFALRLAEIVGKVAIHNNRHITLVFTSAVYRRLAERFLSRYADYPDNTLYGAFSSRVNFILASQLESSFARLDKSDLVFVGLDEEGLRLVVTNDQIPAHSIILLTQRAAQYLRATLVPIVANFQEFKSLKPRIESILRQLRHLPEEKSVWSVGDYVLPPFRLELTSDVTEGERTEDPDAWRIVLETGAIIFRRPNHSVYIYDPSSSKATDRGFRACEVHLLQPGDKLFVMSAELRELVEQALEVAGLPINRDASFEAALRDYHNQVLKLLEGKWPSGPLTEKVRNLRSRILDANPQFDGEFPSEQAVRQWVNLGKSADTPFEDLKPQAPMKEAHFKAFADALGMPALEAAYQWQRVIMAVRNSRRIDGRYVSDVYAYMLLQPESVMVQAKMRPQTLRMLFDKARDSVLSIENIEPASEHSS